MKVREPVARPLDVVAVELLLSASQAFLVGVLLYLAVGFWEDRGIGLGSVAAVVILMGLGVGAAWLYWLIGGVGWPMAGANAAAAIFLGAVLLLTWFGESFSVGGAPLLLAVAAAVYGLLAGVFLDSPRRWRWDQREKLRPGTAVPRISPATQALVAQVPRSRPQRQQEEPVSELAARIESTAVPGAAAGSDGSEPTAGEADLAPDSTVEQGPEEPVEEPLTDAPDVEGIPLEVPEAPEPVMPTPRLGLTLAPDADGPDEEEDAGAIELPTMVEPKAQRSPWAWAAPPEWNRDEDDEPDKRSPGSP